MICSRASGCGPNLAARQTSTDCIIPITEEVGYPDALFCTYFLVGSLTQLVDLHARLIPAGESDIIVQNVIQYWAPMASQSSIVRESGMWDCENCLPCLSRDQ